MSWPTAPPWRRMSSWKPSMTSRVQPERSSAKRSIHSGCPERLSRSSIDDASPCERTEQYVSHSATRFDDGSAEHLKKWKRGNLRWNERGWRRDACSPRIARRGRAARCERAISAGRARCGWQKSGEKTVVRERRGRSRPARAVESASSMWRFRRSARNERNYIKKRTSCLDSRRALRRIPATLGVSWAQMASKMVDMAFSKRTAFEMSSFGFWPVVDETADTY